MKGGTYQVITEKNGQKRFFTNVGIFYAFGKTLRDLKSISQDIIDSIPNGEDLI